MTGKVGFDNFSISNQGATAGFTSTVGLDNGKTDFALYPGGGVEAFAGPIGIRLEPETISISITAAITTCG